MYAKLNALKLTMSNRDRAPRTIQTRCISHIIHLLYCWAQQTPTVPESDGCDNVRFARSIISLWESVKDELINQEPFSRTVIPHSEDYIHVCSALFYSIANFDHPRDV